MNGKIIGAIMVKIQKMIFAKLRCKLLNTLNGIGKTSFESTC